MELLTKKGKVLILDEEDYNIASKFSWNSRLHKNGSELIYTFIFNKKISINKIIFNIESNQVIYHKNGNKYDYTRDNIQIITKNQMGHIIGGLKHENKTSQYSGVYWCNTTKKWWVRVNKEEKPYAECCYDTEEDAAFVADYLALIKFGNLAKRNFPELYFEDIECRYIDIKKKYGVTKSERWAIASQGRGAKNKISQYIGVTENKNRKKKWCARIKYKGKTIYLGDYEVEEDAAKAYDKKALELYGERAKLNFLKIIN